MMVTLDVIVVRKGIVDLYFWCFVGVSMEVCFVTSRHPRSKSGRGICYVGGRLGSRLHEK